MRCALPPAVAFQPSGLLESNEASIMYVCTTPVTCLCSCSCLLLQFIGTQPSIGIAVFRGKRGPSMLFKSGCPAVGEQVMLLSYPQAHVEGLPTSDADPAIHQGLVSQVCNLVGGSVIPGWYIYSAVSQCCSHWDNWRRELTWLPITQVEGDEQVHMADCSHPPQQART